MKRRQMKSAGTSRRGSTIVRLTWGCLFAVVFTLSLLPTAHSADAPEAFESCDCAASSCGACELETGVTFYSAKCGPGNSRVKSCKRPTCAPVEDQKACFAALSGEAAKPAAKRTEALEFARLPASTLPEAGEVSDVAGEVRVMRADGSSSIPKKKDIVYVGDVVETQASGLLQIKLRDDSEMTVAPKSRLKIEKVDVNHSALKRKIALQLMSGKVRSKVQKEYSGENTFEVKTRSAVAGVRGTDFITSFERGVKEWVSEVRTVTGLVHLSAAVKSQDPDASPSAVSIPAGTFAALIHPAVPEGASEAEIDSAAAKSTVTPLYRIKDDELLKLRGSFDYFPGEARAKAEPPHRSLASVDTEEICAAPSGYFNQCSWTCEGNRSGDATCRTDLPGVACVRRLCRANGQWTEPKRMPARESHTCHGTRVQVGECGGYW
jgi:hypothetical protein